MPSRRKRKEKLSDASRNTLTRSALHLQEALLGEMGRLRFQSDDYHQCERLKQSLQSFRNQVSGGVPTGMISTADLHLKMPEDN